MGDYDTAFKRIAAARPGDIAWLFLGYEPSAVEPIAGDLPALRRDLDFAARVSGPEGRFVLHVECESRSRADLALRILEYHVLLHLRERLPVLSAVLSFSGRAGGTPLDTHEYRSGVGGHESIVFRHRVLSLPALEAKELIEPGLAGLLPLVPLARHGAERESLAAAVAAARRAEPAALRPDLLAALAVFAGVAGNRELVYALLRMEEMKESVIYQDILAEGRAEGRAQGRAEGEAEVIVRILERRFGPVPEEVRRRVLAERSMERLDELVDLALAAPSMVDFASSL